MTEVPENITFVKVVKSDLKRIISLFFTKVEPKSLIHFVDTHILSSLLRSKEICKVFLVQDDNEIFFRESKQALSLSLSHTHTHNTHFLSLFLSLYHSLSHTYTNTRTHTHTHTHSLACTIAYTHIRACTRILAHLVRFFVED